MKNLKAIPLILLFATLHLTLLQASAQDHPPGKKTQRSCEAGCGGYAGLRKKSITGNSSAAKTPVKQIAEPTAKRK